MEDKILIDTYQTLFDKVSENHQNQLINELDDIYDGQGAEIYDDIYNFFKRVDTNYTEIQSCKKQGISSEAWFKQKLHQHEEMSPGITKSVLTSLEKTYLEEDKQTDYDNLNVNDPFDAKILSKKTAEFIQHSAYIDLQTVDEVFSQLPISDVVEPIKKVNTIKQAFDANMLDPKDNEVKEILTVGALKIQDKIPFKPVQDLAPVQVAAIVDKTYTTAKLGYKIMNGSMRPADAVDFVVDRATAGLEAAVHKTCVQFGTKAGATVGGVIGGIFGPAGVAVGTMVGGAIGKIGGSIVSKVVNSGIKKVVSSAKEKITNFVSDVKDSVSNFVSGVTSFLGWW